MFLRMLCSALALGSLSWAGSFDPPLSKKTVDLGPSPASAESRSKVTCYWFANFMVKEVDFGGKGATRLAIVPGNKKSLPACSRLRDQGEKVVDPDDWSGYFKGVKGDLVFFDADDGVNGGVGFAIYDAKSGKKIFDDVASGDLQFSDAQKVARKDAPKQELTIRYIRVVDGGCAIPKEPEVCWDKIKTKLGLENVSAPDCKSGYENSAQKLAQGRCQAQSKDDAECFSKEISLARQQTADATSIIAYPVEIKLVNKATVKPVPGDLRCWPSQ